MVKVSCDSSRVDSSRYAYRWYDSPQPALRPSYYATAHCAAPVHVLIVCVLTVHCAAVDRADVWCVTVEGPYTVCWPAHQKVSLAALHLTCTPTLCPPSRLGHSIVIAVVISMWCTAYTI